MDDDWDDIRRNIPDDRPDVDSSDRGVDSDVDALDEHEWKQNHMDTTRVDVDPALFGMFPDHDIEKSINEWERQVTLIKLTGACPQCDGRVDRDELTDPSGNDIIDFMCDDCEAQWIARP